MCSSMTDQARSIANLQGIGVGVVEKRGGEEEFVECEVGRVGI